MSRATGPIVSPVSLAGPTGVAHSEEHVNLALWPMWPAETNT